MGRHRTHSVSPPMGRPETCPGKECVCGHHCLATSHMGTGDCPLPPHDTWGMGCFPLALEVQHSKACPSLPSSWFYCLLCSLYSSLMCFPTAGPLHVLYPWPGIFSILPLPSPSPLPSSYSSLRAPLGLPFLRRKCPGCPGEMGFLAPPPLDPCCLPAGSNYMDSGMSVQLISVPTTTPKVSWSLLPPELLVKPFSVGPKKQTRSAQPCFLPGSRAQHFLPNLPSLLPVGSRMEGGVGWGREGTDRVGHSQLGARAPGAAWGHF